MGQVTTPDLAELTALVDRWLAGFVLSRGVPMTRVGPLVEVDIDNEVRRLELVMVEPGPDDLRDAIARIEGASDVWITIFTTAPLPPDIGGSAVYARLTDERLMTRDLTSPAGADPRVELTVEGDRAFAVVRLGGELASQGQVAVVGTDAVYDRIGTHDPFKRQGLASVVMGALDAWVVGRGATRGILAATVEGQGLYGRLGWRDAGCMLTLAAT